MGGDKCHSTYPPSPPEALPRLFFTPPSPVLPSFPPGLSLLSGLPYCTPFPHWVTPFTTVSSVSCTGRPLEGFRGKQLSPYCADFLSCTTEHTVVFHVFQSLHLSSWVDPEACEARARPGVG